MALMVGSSATPSLELRDVGASYGSSSCADGRNPLSGITTPVLHGGEVVAVLGPNGAGKSTLFRRIAGLVRGPGSVLVNGSADRAGRQPCYLPQDSAAAAVLTVYEAVLLARKQEGRGGWSVDEADLELVDGVLDDLGIDDLAFRNLAELSGGQRQLVSIAQTLVREPEILLMDEPTSALDPAGRRAVRGILEEVRSQGIAVLLNSHLLSEVELVCDRVIILAAGAIVAQGRPDEMATARAVEIETGTGVRSWQDATREDIPQLVADLVASGERVYAVRSRRPTLEEVYLEAVRGEMG
jgi:iron complex transport system ATP-binding protein